MSCPGSFPCLSLSNNVPIASLRCTMKTKAIPFALGLLIVILGILPAAAQSRLEGALAAMYKDCLFPTSPHFQNSIALSQLQLAPGISTFIENNLAAIPLTPPTLEPAMKDGEIVAAVSGFAPIYTESSATLGERNAFLGANYSFFNLSRIRGQNLSDVGFQFAQDGDGGDIVTARMPLDVDASVFSLYASYGVTDWLDVGFALPLVTLRFNSRPTTFRIIGNDTGLRYGGEFDSADYRFVGDQAEIFLPPSDEDPAVVRDENPVVPQSETYVSTIAVRAKLRLPVTSARGASAVLVEVRVPAGRSTDNALGEGNFGVRLMLIGELVRQGGFKPYVNVGGQYWDGSDSSGLKLATGFNQQLSSKLFFSFDLLGEIDLERDNPLTLIDRSNAFHNVTVSNIPAMGYEHTFNGALGLQFALSPRVHAYGSALFSFLSAGLQSTVAPTIGVALH